MNILTGVHFAPNTTAVTIFYTYFSSTANPEAIKFKPGIGDKKCEMFKRTYIKKVSLFENGITFKFKETGTMIHGIEQKGYRSFKLHLHPEREIRQVETLADLIKNCGLSGLMVLEYFSKLIGGIDTDNF